MTDQKSPLDQGARSGWIYLVGWIAAAVGVPSVVAALSTGHWLLGIVLLVVAIVLAGAAGLVRGLWREKYQSRAFDWLSAGLDRRVSRFGRRYREYLLADLRFIDLKGLSVRPYDPELTAVYVDVALAPRDPGKVPSSDLRAAEIADLPVPGQRHLITDFLGKPRPRVLVVIGAPGSGKTTLLRHTASELCLSRRRPRPRRGTPVLLALRDHFGAITADPNVPLPVLVSGVLARYGLTEPSDWLERQLRAGKCLVLLDGLDEVAREEDRKTVSEWVTVQVTRYPGNDFVVTSRPLGYQSAPIEGAITLQAQPFTPEQVSQFVHSWYLAESKHSTGADDHGITRQAAAEAEDLLVRLRRTPALRALTVNPLLLTMIAIVHRHRGALPGSRADLYAQICQVLLWRRQDVKKLKVEPRGDQKERLMRVLAYEMMCARVHDLSTREAIAILRPALHRIAKYLEPEDFLADAAMNGLFIERETGVRAFAHPTFQEYLAAAHIKDKGLQDVLMGWVNDTWWQETILLYVAGTDAGPIVKACLAANTLPALTLALACGQEAAELADDLRDKLEALLAAGLAPGADSERRKLMIGATVAGHLRESIPTDSGTRLCPRAITTGVYGFFLEDMAERGQHRPPDAPSAQLDDPDNVVTGVRGTDAAAFVDWVNEITNAQQTYRLPRLAEIEDPAVRDLLAESLDAARHCIWTASENPEGAPRLYTPEGSALPGTIDGTVVQDHVKADFLQAPLVLGLLPLMIPAKTAVQMLRINGLDFEPVPDLAAALDLATTAVLDQALGYDTAFLAALNITTALDRGSNGIATSTLNHSLAQDLDHNQDRDPSCGLVDALDLASALAAALGCDSASALTSAINQARRYASELSRDLTADHAFDILHDLATALANNSGAEIFLGRALSRMVASRVGGIKRGENTTAHVLVEAMADTFSAQEIQASGYLASPDLLTDPIRSTIDRLREKLADVSLPSTEWARQAADRFDVLVEPISAREQPVTARTGAVLRILALCLAAEADAMGETDLSEYLRVAAATITWMERRNAGDEQPVETIVLALDS
jgi:hypothetical protein